jgi:hypothetical protein
MAERRFPPSWQVTEGALAHVYFEEQAGRQALKV